MMGKQGGERIYKSVREMIAGLKAGEIRAAAELGYVIREAIKDQKAADEVLTIMFALLAGKTRRKMLNDPSAASAKVIEPFPKKPKH